MKIFMTIIINLENKANNENTTNNKTIMIMKKIASIELVIIIERK